MIAMYIEETEKIVSRKLKHMLQKKKKKNKVKGLLIGDPVS